MLVECWYALVECYGLFLPAQARIIPFVIKSDGAGMHIEIVSLHIVAVSPTRTLRHPGTAMKCATNLLITAQ